MIENTTVLGTMGLLAGLTTVIVEVAKQILPKSIPTKVVTIIVAFIVTMCYTCITTPINIVNVLYGVAASFMVAYVAMFGFDSLRDIFKRFKGNEEVDE